MLSILFSGCYTGVKQSIPEHNVAFEEIKIKREDEAKIEEQLKELQKISEDEYKISPGDEYDIYVFDNPDLETKGVKVMADGTLSMGLIGVVSVGGMTIEQATKEIESRLNKYLRNSNVTLVPTKIKSANVTIVGAVINSGIYTIKTGYRITDVVAAAQGFLEGKRQGDTIEMSNLTLAFISRDNKVLPVDFVAIFKKGNALNNIPVKDGDYIYIPSAMSLHVFVLGEVTNPGYCSYVDNLTITRALAFAKGRRVITSEIAVVVRGKLINPTVYKVDIEDILRGRAPDFKLEPNDIVYIPSGPISDYNLVINKIMPTFEAATLIMAPIRQAVPGF